MCKNARKFVSSVAIILIWLWRTTPALIEIGDLFVCTTKLGSVPFVVIFLNNKVMFSDGCSNVHAKHMVLCHLGHDEKK